MKIGIITFHRAENFGAVMQCYALQTYLSLQGHNVQIIDYRCKTIEQVYHVFNPSMIFQGNNCLQMIRAYCGRLKTWKGRIDKKKLYFSFCKKYLMKTEPLYAVEEIDKDFEVIIVGSDQVWNTVLTGGIDSVYFLNCSTSARKIAYAVSTEEYSYPHYKANADKLSALIGDFHSISVREESFKDELNKYTDRNITVCIDPVFLMSEDFYLNILTRPKEKDYILVYHLIDSYEMSVMAGRIGEKEHKKVIELHAAFGKEESSGNVIHKYNVGPTELLGYIADAEMVLTTSFHGLVFSIMFHKPFWVIDNGSTARQKHLLKTLELESRIIQDVNTIRENEAIDFAAVEERKKGMIECSVKYLLEAVKQ